ncbi:MAG TPA: hypothetical protein VFG80_07065, partial [Myxococcota bacterium]|nr:hypothetical protein [Myxococcota bacterium]
RWIERRALTSERLTRLYLERIAKLGPRLECVVTVTAEHALAQRLLAPEGFASPLAAPLRAELARPLYVLVVRSDAPGAFDAIVAKLDRAPESFEPVYRTEGAAIYRLREGAGDPEALRASPRPGERRAPRVRDRRARPSRERLPCFRSRRRTRSP